MAGRIPLNTRPSSNILHISGLFSTTTDKTSYIYISAFSHIIEFAMNSPSPSKPKWSPGGAIRRTSTILSMGRSKTPSRSSSIHESDPSLLKGVATVPAAPTPKPVSPKSTLSTGSPSKEPTVTPSKSTLARMGTALRRPSSLIPRRRTTSTASSFRDGDSTPSKTASAVHSSTKAAPVTKSVPATEPAAEPQVTEPAVPEPQSSIPDSEPAHVSSPVIDSIKETQFTGKAEEILRQETVGQHEYVTPIALTTKEARDDPIALGPMLAPLVAEQISAEPEAEEPSLVPISTARPPSEQLSAQAEVEKSSLALISSPVPTTEQISAQPEVEEPSIVPHSTEEAVPTLATDTATLPPEAEKQSAVSTSTTETVPAPPISEPTDSLPKVVEDALPPAGPAPHDAIVEEPPVNTSSSPVVETGVAAASTPEHIVQEPLREVSSLNSSFEDLALSVQPTEDEVVVVQKDAVVDQPSVLLSPVDVVSVPAETKEQEKGSPVATAPAAEKSLSIHGTESIPEVVKERYQPVVEGPASMLPVTQEPQPLQRSLPLEIPTTSAESAAPSPTATHPLLPLEVQETSARQNVGLLGPARDHHTKTPQEYRSMLRKLLDGLVDLIRQWRRCLW